MKCRFNSKYECRKYIKDCLKCDMRNIKTLDGIDIIPTFFQCPYCLYTDKLEGFFLFNPNNKLLKIKECPDCHNRLLEFTLRYIYKCSLEELANFIVEYPYWDFWKKANYRKFWERLDNSGLAEKFKEAYDKRKSYTVVKDVK